MTIKIDHVYLKQLDKIIVDTIACGATEVMIAGGAIRDMLLQKPIKDIDVFYKGTLNDETLKELFVIKDKLVSDEQKEDNDYYKEVNNWQIYADSIHHHAIDLPVQLIVVNSETPLPEHILTFGCNLSKVLYNGHICMSEFFLDDLWLEQLTFTKDLRTGNYKDKMIKKYPTFSVVDESDLDTIPSGW
jgi:hypothetical protein